MNVGAVKTDRARILPLRALFLEEIDAQVRYDACHGRGWTDSYLLTADEAAVGYGAIKGLNEVADRDTVFEFYVSPPWRRHAGALFRALLDASGARHVECQSNDRLLAGMLFEFAQNVRSDVVLFEAHAVTDLAFPGGLVRARRESDRIFDHTVEPVGDCVLEVQGEIVATGGFFLHYNPPFADLYMEVSEPHRRRGAAATSCRRSSGAATSPAGFPRPAAASITWARAPR